MHLFQVTLFEGDGWMRREVKIQEGMQTIVCKFWTNDATPPTEVTVGDHVQVQNMTVNKFRGRTSLNSTPETNTVV